MIIKESSFIDDIVSSVSNLVDKDRPIASIVNILGVNAMMVALGPAWGILVGIANAMGINVTSIFDTLKNVVGSFLEYNGTSPVNVESTAKQLAEQTLSQVGMDSSKADQNVNDLLEPEKVEAYIKYNERLSKYGSGKGMWLVTKLLGAGLSGRGFFVYLLTAIVKGLLIGAGLSLAGGAIVSAIKGTAPKNNPSSANSTTTPQTPTTHTPSQGNAAPYEIKLNRLTGSPSGQGEKLFLNNAGLTTGEANSNKAWFIFVNNGLDNWLYRWIIAIYPDAQQAFFDHMTNNFQAAFNPLKQEMTAWNPEEDIAGTGIYLRVPSKYKKVRHIVDTFLSRLLPNSMV